MDHFLLSDDSELSGLWGPNLFSYRKGFSPHVIVCIMRRSIYKVLKCRRAIWVLEWDESGAFPKLQFQVMDRLPEITSKELGDVMWMCGDRFDQFCKRLEIYPGTYFGLGLRTGPQMGFWKGTVRVRPSTTRAQQSGRPVGLRKEQ